MQKYLSLSIFGLILATNWVLFSDEAGGFKILAPQQMNTVSKQINTTIGPTTIHTFYTLPEPDSSQYFSVSYYDLDTSAIPLTDSLLQDLLWAIKSELLSGFHAVEAYSTLLDLPKGKGMLFRAGYHEATQVMKVQLRIYSPRVFILQVLLPHKMALSPIADRFFDSFEYLRN